MKLNSSILDASLTSSFFYYWINRHSCKSLIDVDSISYRQNTESHHSTLENLILFLDISALLHIVYIICNFRMRQKNVLLSLASKLGKTLPNSTISNSFEEFMP